MSTINVSASRQTDKSPDGWQLTSNQQLIRLGQQKHPDVPLYEVPYVFHLQGDLDAGVFRAAFVRLVESCELLRMVATDRDWSDVGTLCAVPDICRFLDYSADARPDVSAEDYVRACIVRPLRPTHSLFDSCLMRTGDASWQWFLKLHHLITDGWNTNLLVQHLSVHYQAILDETPSPALPQYAAFRDFETENAHSDTMPSHRAWWAARTTPLTMDTWYTTASSELRLHHKRVVVPLTDTENRAINTAVTQPPWRQFSPALSQFQLFATALSLLLFRLRPHQTVRFGVTSHGRSQPEFRDTIGLFMQLLPFQVRVAGNDTPVSVADRVAAEMRGFLQHAVPGCMQPETATAFDVALNLLDLTVEDFAGLPVAASWRHNGFGDPERRLTISAHQPQGTDDWELIFDFNLEHFPFAHHAAVIEQFRGLLQAVIDQQHQPVGSINWLSRSQHALNERCLGTVALPESRHGRVWDRFAQVADSCETRIAISTHSTQMTYTRLRCTAEQLGEDLRSANAAGVVPVLCRRNQNAVPAFLGVLASGRAFMPIDADQPQERITSLLAESGATHVIEAVGEPVVVALQAPVSAPSTWESACYVLSTSGTTGRPNAVQVSDSALLNLLDNFESLSPQAGGRCAWWTNVGFDVAIYEVFSAVLFGRTLCLPDDRSRNSPQQFFAWLSQEQVTSAYLPPFFVAAFASHLERNPRIPLKRLLVGVEPIPQSTLARIAAREGLTVINGYGPTEATVCATLHVIDPADHRPTPASIGRPLRGNVLRIEDPFGQLVPPGMPGELLIGGEGLADGYRGNAELTARRFVSVPADSRSERWYRTGDLVRMREDGTLQFVGRTDDQLKIRGHRIEPSGILTVLRSLVGVRDAVVDADRQPDREPVLVTWVCGEVTEDQVRTQLRQRLPRSHVPTVIYVQSDDLPRTINGKPDLASLRQLMAQTRITSTPAVATSTEQRLLAAWQEIIGDTSCSVTTNLFESGGDSLDVLRLIATAADQGIRLTMSDVFDRPTIRELSVACEQAHGSRPAVDAPAETSAANAQTTNGHAAGRAPKAARSTAVAMSPAQKGLWYVVQTTSTPAAYLLQLVAECDGRLETDVLSACIGQLIDRHQALSTGLQTVDGQPQLSVCSQARMTEDVIHVTDRSELDAAIRAQAARDFAFDGGELVRLAHVILSEQTSVLVLTGHHIILDQHSVRLILEELAMLYRQRKSGEATCETRPLAPAASQYVHWREQHRAQATVAHRKYWQEKLQPVARRLALPADRDGEWTGPSTGRLSDFQLPPAVTRVVRRFAAEHQVTLNCVLLSAWQVLLQRYSQETRFSVGVPITRRADAALFHTVGFFVEALPLPCEVDPGASFLDLVVATEAEFRQASNAFTLSVPDILSAIGPGGATGQLPYQTMFVMQSDQPPLDFGSVATSRLTVSDLQAAKFDLTLFVTDDRSRDSLFCQLEYRDDAFQAATVARIQSHWCTLVEQLVTASERPVGVACFAGEADRRLLSACNRSDRDDSLLRQPAALVRADVRRQIELQAAARPSAVAVEADDGRFTFAQLHERAAMISDQLQACGVREGHSVALLLERSRDMVAAVLGVLKAGAAWVPLDPRQPAARLQSMMSDAGIAAAVSQPAFAHHVSADLPVVVPGQSATCERRPPADAIVQPGLAYVMFTSGSTGRPKGVEVSHAALWESTMARQEFYAENPDAFLLLSPLWFDSSVAGLFWTLTTGGTLVLPQEQDIQDVVKLGRMIARFHVSHTLCLPTVYQLLLQHNDSARLQSLRTVIVAGEACPAPLVAEHHHRLPQSRLYNEYGPTEASVWATCCLLRHDPRSAGQPRVAIGRSVPGITVQLLDSQLQPVPAGVPGEIVLSGSRLAEGYRNDKELTRERFPVIDGQRCYRTGDLAQLTTDGMLQFLGRRDSQIKIRGQRIEVEEIEAVLSALPGVHEAAAGLAAEQRQVSSDVVSLQQALQSMDARAADELLQDIERLAVLSDDTTPADVLSARRTSARTATAAETQHAENVPTEQVPTEQVPTKEVGAELAETHDDRLIREQTDQVSVDLSVHRPGFIAAPRLRQRKWMIRQAMKELVDNLQHLHDIAPTLVAGSDEHHLPRDLSTAQLTDQEIMEDWQTPLMRAMAEYGCQSGDDVLEIGFGRGVAADFIQQQQVHSHTIIEMNDHSIDAHFRPWHRRHAEQNVRLIHGRWQESLGQLEDFDSVFFHAFPMNESEFEEHVLNSATYAEHFFEVAADLLRPGGVFTYMTTEIDSLSRRHQRSLLRHFSEIQMKVISLDVPATTRDAWWADSMVVVRAIR